MSTTAAPHLTHASASEVYDPDDDVLPRNSPLLQPRRDFRLSPTEPLSAAYPIVSSDSDSSSSPGTPPRSHRRMKVSQGDAVLVGHLDGGRRPEIALQAGFEALPSDTDDEDDPASDVVSDSSGDGSVSQPSHHGSGGLPWDQQAKRPGKVPESRSVAAKPPDPNVDMGAFDLKSLAADALAVANTDPPPEPMANAGPTPPVSENDVVKEKHVPAPLNPGIAIRRSEPRKEPRPIQPATRSPYSPRSLYSPRETGAIPLAPVADLGSPSNNGLAPTRHGEGLPPIQMHSPRSESNGQTPLPSIRSQLGDINQLAHNHAAAEKERQRLAQSNYPHSPPSNLRMPSMHHGSPPISPAETFRARAPQSPNDLYAVASPGYYYHSNGPHRSPHDYASSATVTPGSEQSASTPATSIAEKMSIDGLTIQSAVYVCKYKGCTAAPFQTQYLLNSHANVHSSNRPHFCPVKGCPRSEGGKGFKRKNEMIRHGLVHDSPGYVCPFCPDREHKYPRPDNLQRWVPSLAVAREIVC